MVKIYFEKANDTDPDKYVDIRTSSIVKAYLVSGGYLTIVIFGIVIILGVLGSI